MTTNKEIAKEFIYENKLYTGKTLNEALRITLKGVPAVSRKVKTEIYNEYKEDEAMDKLRAFNFIHIGRKAAINTNTNLAL
jgi:hypothetical protein